MNTYALALKKYIAPASLLPKYGRHVDDRIVTMDKERLLGVIELQGVPFETTPNNQLFSAFNAVTRIMSEIGKINAPRVAQWNHIYKKQVSLEFDYKFDNAFVADFAAKYLSQFQGGKFYRTTYAISFVYKYEDSIEQGVEALNMLLDFALKALSRYDPVALGVEINSYGVAHSQIGRFLGRLLNHNDDIVPVTSDLMVNSIQTSEIYFGFDLAEIRPAKGGKKYATYYDLRDYPEDSKRGMWNALLSEPYEFVLTQSFHHSTAMRSLGQVNSQINRMESGTNYPEHYVDDLKAARSFISSGEISTGEFHSALVVYGDTQKEAIDNGNSLTTTLLASSAARFLKATGSGIYTYYSMMPGSQFKPLAEPKSTRNLACGFSMNNFPTGKQHGNPIGDGSAVIPLKTRSDSIFFFNTHYSAMGQDVRGQKYPGHMLCLGATGAGKTTFEGVVVGFLTRFNPGIFAIDFNRSMQLFLETYGTVYFDIEDGHDTGLNPFQLPDSPGLRSFLYRLVGACGRNADGTLEAADEAAIKEAVDTIMLMDMSDRRFSYLSSLIPLEGGSSLGDRLAKWQASCGGSLAWALDSPVNKFDPNTMRRIGFNTTSILKKDHPATEAILAVLFHIKDMMQQGGELFLSLVEEFWVPANYPTTQEQIKGALKAGRIKGEFMFLVSQSPEDAINCAIFPDIVQMTPTKVFLPNPDATFESYKQCGLNEKEFDDLYALDKESRTFLIKQGHQSTFAKLDLAGYDEYLPIISGSWESIQLSHEVRREFGDDPAVWVPVFRQRLREWKKQGAAQ
ncbi:Type IV secretion system protein virB4 [Pseudomonas fluorescens]|uniref:VirB4 family type IV secretion/conjugal transfer ATPase n=1 Tax=Pseudomonas fluorescens TaxID=294 RepID=UPI001242444E|nr:VirB4 family type IV secretion system protein [Pseudomonas fluorescens]VVN22318.1 Type IV secretion system protein virB4 [Pseudomonas fluorescens]